MFGKLQKMFLYLCTFFLAFETVPNSVFEPGDLYTELAQNKAGIVLAAR